MLYTVTLFVATSQSAHATTVPNARVLLLKMLLLLFLLETSVITVGHSSFSELWLIRNCLRPPVNPSGLLTACVF